MKKIVYLFLCLLIAPVFASDKLYVKALEDFNSIKPKESFRAQLIEDNFVEDTYIKAGSVLNCSLKKVTDPKRAKRDAKIYFNFESYTDNKGTHNITPSMIAKYSKTVISVKEVKKNPPVEGTKTAVRTVGGVIIPGFSYAFSFVDGMKQNTEDNRLKSGAKKVYDDSIISMVEYGEQIMINKGDEFYLIVKEDKERENSSELENEINLETEVESEE